MATIAHPARGTVSVQAGWHSTGSLHMTRKAGWSVLLRVPTLGVMPVTIDLPAETQARLEDEAARRGVTLEQLIADLAANLPDATTPRPKHRLSFVGIGASGRSEAFDIHRERADLAATKLAEGV